ncbi:DUF4296 domain-containing protein [Dysgonomonas sp. 216]|uniref:DUF4296 domain-containing protein n=1 Tax=Dysgonomonas sp. 216 TaxID=2302934 RepID=UPI0013D16E40|nr:DUF4296 domain-containing protein [Dysgonomonas sp. 216]NDW17593.1 DUF4296 domain-containing protein [Dysgonomonas sp. 216]
MKRNKVLYYILGFCLFAGLQSCNNNEYVMSRGKMEDVLYDLQLAQALMQNKAGVFNTDQQKEALLNDIFQKHKITKEVLDSSLVWYADHIEMYVRVNDSVTARLRRQHLDVDKIYRRSSDARDSKSSGILPSYTYLSKDRPFVAFNIDSFAIRKENPSVFSIDFNILGVPDSSKVNLSMLFEYADTNIIVSHSLNDSSFYSISNTLLNDRALNYISGYVYADSLDIKSRVLLYNITLKYDSTRISVDETKEEPLQKITHRISSDSITRTTPVVNEKRLINTDTPISNDRIDNSANRRRNNFKERQIPQPQSKDKRDENTIRLKDVNELKEVKDKSLAQ